MKEYPTIKEMLKEVDREMILKCLDDCNECK